MRLIDADEAKKQVRQMQTLEPSEKNLLALALDRTPTYEPPNDPLTLEELREMDGKPVWIESKYSGGWHILDSFWNERVYMLGDAGYIIGNYGKTWLAYRRKPEEGTT